MAKKNISGRKPSGMSGIAITEDPTDLNQATEAMESAPHAAEAKPVRPTSKAKEDQSSSGNVGIGEIRKAAAFANSVGGLDKALALLQILKVAKEVL